MAPSMISIAQSTSETALTGSSNTSFGMEVSMKAKSWTMFLQDSAFSGIEEVGGLKESGRKGF